MQWFIYIIIIALQSTVALFVAPLQLDTPSLCVSAYQDVNRNGFNDNEPPLAGVRVVIRDTNGQAVASLTTSESPQCLDAIEDGAYQLWVEDGPYRVFDPPAQSLQLTEELTIIELAGLPADIGIANEVCVTVYNDVDRNGVQEDDEPILEAFDVYLLSDNIIIATKRTSLSEATCFVGLEEGAYRVRIPQTARHLMTTRADAAPTFVGVGSRYNVAFGVIQIDPFTEDALLPGLAPDSGELSLDAETRLLLAIMGSGIVILLMIGVGSVGYALFKR